VIETHRGLSTQSRTKLDLVREKITTLPSLEQALDGFMDTLAYQNAKRPEPSILFYGSTRKLTGDISSTGVVAPWMTSKVYPKWTGAVRKLCSEWIRKLREWLPRDCTRFPPNCWFVFAGWCSERTAIAWARPISSFEFHFRFI
jgi:hypothetical protein